MAGPILIPIYNFKGGIGKTTATYNIGYILSEIFGLKVLMIDADPQCNLTGLIYAENFIDFEKAARFYQTAEAKANQKQPQLITLGNIFKPILDNKQPNNLEDAKRVKLSSVHEYENLFFIPGHLSTSGLDKYIALSTEGLGMYANIPGYITNLIREIGRLNKIDVILLDLNPSFSLYNGSLIMGSDYFILPFSSDFFSLQAMQSLQTQLPIWHQSLHEFDNKRQQFGLIQTTPKFLGTYPQKVRTRYDTIKKENAVEQAYGSWIDSIYKDTLNLVRVLKEHKMCSEGFALNKVEGVIDFVSVGLDVQASGRPITDLNYNHKHQVSSTQKKSLTSQQYGKKKDALIAYKKVIGSLFRNLSDEDLDALESSSNGFKEKLQLSSNLLIDFDAELYIQPPRTPSLNYEDQHYYTNEEIDNLILHYFNQNNEVYTYRAISSDYLDEMTSALNEIEDGRHGRSKAIIPINLGNYHWVLFYVRYSANASPEFYYFDPLGNINVQKNLLVAIGKKYEDVDEVYALDQRVQEDNYNCGPWIIEAALSLTRDGSLPPQPPEFNINEKRFVHNHILQTSNILNDSSSDRSSSSPVKKSFVSRLKSNQYPNKTSPIPSESSKKRKLPDVPPEVNNNNEGSKSSKNSRPLSLKLPSHPSSPAIFKPSSQQTKTVEKPAVELPQQKK